MTKALADFKFQLQMASKDRTPECIVNPNDILQLIERIEYLDASNAAMKVKLRIAKAALSDAADSVRSALKEIESNELPKSIP